MLIWSPSPSNIAARLHLGQTIQMNRLPGQRYLRQPLWAPNGFAAIPTPRLIRPSQRRLPRSRRLMGPGPRWCPFEWHAPTFGDRTVQSYQEGSAGGGQRGAKFCLKRAKFCTFRRLRATSRWPIIYATGRIPKSAKSMAAREIGKRRLWVGGDCNST